MPKEVHTGMIPAARRTMRPIYTLTTSIRTRTCAARLVHDLADGVDHGLRRLIGNAVAALGDDDLASATRQLDELRLDFVHPDLVVGRGLSCHLRGGCGERGLGSIGA
jgi:hypothetical protein